MFRNNSRYHGIETVTVAGPDGREVSAVKLRRLPEVSGTATTVGSGEQLDVMSERRYRDATRYWHIADANSELEAGTLVTVDGRVINVPER